MKFLHIADLHLGKKLHETSLHNDQSFMLQQIIKLLKADTYDALFLCGDIYDQSMPPQAAVQLFGNFLDEIRRELSDLPVFIISGNHDSSLRLAYASGVFRSQKIFIQTEFSDECSSIVLKTKNESCAIFMLPFLQQSLIDKKSSAEISDQLDVMKYALEMLQEKKRTDMPNVLLAHCLTFIPGKEMLSEDGSPVEYWGTAQLLPTELFDGFDYVALGHIHRMMKITDRIYYSGSPFEYSFKAVTDKAYEKYALSVEINCSEKNPVPQIKPLPIPQLHLLHALRGSFFDFISTDKFNAYRKDYLQIELVDSEAIGDAMRLLQQNFPNTMHIKQDAFDKNIFDGQQSAHTENIDEKDFTTIYKMFIDEIESETDDTEMELAKKIWDEIGSDE